MDFIDTLLRHNFLQNALVAGILASIACGITGTFVIIKRITFISGGIAHTALGGIGIAYYFGVNPLIGASLSALFAAIILGVVTIKMNEQSDTVIGALWAIGMATGVIFISITPGYNVNLMSYLFGNILMVSGSDLYILLILDAAIIFTVMLFFRQFISISFDEDYSRLRGLWVNTVYILLLCLIAFTIVILIQIVGLILVIALLTLPAAISRIYLNRIVMIIFSSIILGLFFTISGLILSYNTNLPAGATIIVIAGSIYLLALSFKKVFA